MRKILTYGGYFERFMENLSAKEALKVQYVVSLLASEERLPKKFIKFIREELFELRIAFDGNAFRVFFIFDEGNIVVLFNGFSKKTQKTPRKEIEKALKLKEAYYEDKQSRYR
ncbi:type II toxin-antitoxin system RelE/ParE family toxin [bacterium]|nr:type II toxin-antitoxin system RelE/ParE family toxin [bacterium]